MDATKRSRIKVTCEGGKPQQIRDFLITVRRKKRGDRYVVTIEPILQLTTTESAEDNSR